MMYQDLKAWSELSSCGLIMFTSEKKHIHAGIICQNNVYIINLICRCVRWFSLRKAHIHASSTHGSSIYLIKYVLVSSVCCCSVLGYYLGFSYCILVIAFLIIRLMEWLIDSIVVGSKGDWLMWIYLMIEWCCWWIQSENLWNVVPGRKEKVVAFCKRAPMY